MAYRFEPDESVREAITRCAGEQLDRAVQELSPETENDPVAAVHAARKAVKKERALLRVAQGTLGSRQRATENGALRDAARSLSGVRDADVMIQTLDELSHRFSGQLPESAFAAVRKQLKPRRSSERARGTAKLSAEAMQDLSAVRARVDDWKLERDGWGAIDDGLLRTYRRGRESFWQAREEPSLENLHAWRKRVKDLWYQLRLLTPVCGPTVGGQAEEAHRLADCLGDDHDLGVLKQTLLQIGRDLAIDLDGLLGLVDYRRGELQTEAMHVGQRLYAEKAKPFGRRIHRYWDAGRAQARAANESQPAKLAEATRGGPFTTT